MFQGPRLFLVNRGSTAGVSHPGAGVGVGVGVLTWTDERSTQAVIPLTPFGLSSVTTLLKWPRERLPRPPTCLSGPHFLLGPWGNLLLSLSLSDMY